VNDKLQTPATKAITDAVIAAGGRPYFVGGCVRDAFLGLEPKDRDLLVHGLDVGRLMEVVSRAPGCQSVNAVGQSFGVVKVTIQDETVDVALPRTERSTGAGHRDFAVVTDPSITVEQDLGRRDFTMNALALCAVTGMLVDPYNGLADLRRGELQSVGHARDRFIEDPLRMLRAVRFQARLGLRLSEHVQIGVIDSARLLPTVAVERVFDEVSRLLMAEGATAGLDSMVRLGMMKHVIPEWMESVGFEQRNHHHDRTVDRHVLAALDYAISRNASLRCRWAVLLHDIAKPRTFEVDADGHGHFYGHEDQGMIVAGQILERLKAPVEFTQQVVHIVGEHLRPPADASDRVLRRFTAAMGEKTEDALLCRESDLYAHAGAELRVAEVQQYRERIRAFAQVSGFTQAKLALRGDEIATLFGVSGAGIGRLKVMGTAAVIDGVVPNEHDALVEYLKTVVKEMP
jgi:tRNA nucleotidyltransferase/poly(A) polymerase